MPRVDFTGRVLGERYHVGQKIAEGGFGDVYRALDAESNRAVAIKLLTGGDAAMHARFRREMAVQRRLNHPVTVRLLDFDEQDDFAYMVQEYVPGRTLQEVVDADGPLAPERAAQVFSALLDALTEAHGQGVVHRDLKPDNIMLVDDAFADSPDTTVRLLDFGIAKVVAGEHADHGLTSTGVMIGTPAYLSPEQARKERIGPRTDVYSMGCVLFFALTGRAPYIGGTLAVVMAHVSHPPPPVPDSVPRQLADVVRRAMAKAPSARFESAAEMKGALQGAPVRFIEPTAQDVPTKQTPIVADVYDDERDAAPAPEPAPIGPSRRVALAIGLVVAGVVGAIATVILGG